ncbi:MAG: ABC transporter permease [Actinobacteria bacterium]|nr:ABC transporter permease [Actinomycetota bacterium]MCL6088223.1 ABC transporter permease [Actinomycetota bacterium]
MKTNKVLDFFNEQKIFVVIILIAIILTIKTTYFISFTNIINILMFISIEGIIVIGMTYLIILKELDLSIGSTMALSGVLAIYLQKYGIFVGIISGLLLGMAVGLLNGFLVTKLKLTSIAVTLGTMVMLNGFVFAFTNSATIKGTNKSFPLIANTTVFKIPIPIVVFLVLVIIFEIILKRTYFGRNIYAVGGNIIASKFFGIKVEMVRIAAFVLTGFLAGLAGVLLASKINIASGRIGLNTAILVITAVLLGGVSLSGGEGSVFKAFQGMLLIGILNNAMVILQINDFIQDIIRGSILIIILIIAGVSINRAKYI